jgi:hypothetical protein
MTASVPSVPLSDGWTVAQPTRGLATRLFAATLFVATGLVMAATVIGLSIASAVIARGNVIADAGDVATIRALTPVFALFGVVAVASVVAGLGIVFGSRNAAALGIGLGVFDAIAGFVALVIAATGPASQADGVGIAMSFLMLGIVLAIVARAADWNTHGPVDEA